MSSKQGVKDAWMSRYGKDRDGLPEQTLPPFNRIKSSLHLNHLTQVCLRPTSDRVQPSIKSVRAATVVDCPLCTHLASSVSSSIDSS